jgi:hypothetical protein
VILKEESPQQEYGRKKCGSIGETTEKDCIDYEEDLGILPSGGS